MEKLGLSACAIARDRGVPPNRITGVVNGEREITAATALRPVSRFNTGAEFRMNLQGAHDVIPRLGD